MTPPAPGEGLAAYLERTAASLIRADVVRHWTRATLERALRDGQVIRILPNVYCARAHAATPATLGRALNLWAPQGLVTGPLALALISPQLPAPSRVHLVVPYGQHLKVPSWVVLLQRPPTKTATMAQSVRCVSAERALLDAWVDASPADRVDLVYRALWERACTWRQLKRELDRAKRVRGRRELEELLDWFQRGATSPLEVRARRDVYTGPRFADLEWQAPLDVPCRRPVADILHRRAMVVIELDSRAFHRDRKDYDRRRDIDLAAAGYITIRLTWNDITARAQWCRERVLAVIAARLAVL